MIKESPCFNCTKHNTTAEHNCHEDCVSYLLYKQELEELRKLRMDDVYTEYIVNAVYRKRRKKK